MPRVVTASEANQNFSRLLREASGGETITITQRGRPVARLMPSLDESDVLAKQAAGIDRFLAAAKTWPRRTVAGWTRDELYDD